MAESVSDSSVQCPVCAGLFEPSSINRHLDACLQSPSDPGPPAKKPRINSSDSRPSAVFSMFQSRPRASEALAEDSGESAAGSAAPAAAVQQPQCPAEVAPPAACSPRALRLKNQKPLAELLRPSTLEEYFGQNKLIGEQTLLRSLLKSQEIPSLILWGPPGCGKTTLAHIIASSIKQKGTGRFVTLSATSASVSDVREVIKQAQNELRLCKRKTVLFIDEIHRFNKSQQDTFLPHVECGTITLIGATTENPSFQVNSALLSRCRVLVLERLSVEAVGSILRRAVDFLDLRILDSEERHSSEICSEAQVCVEQKALDTLAHLCDGDARAALNGLQLAVQACVLQSSSNHNRSSTVVREQHIKEALQRSHILYDKAGEEHYNCISALHKSMRGSDANAALYWLARMLEGGEDPLYVARRLVRFASEDIGLADPVALSQAVAAFQACHLIGMPECEVILAQCAVYLARAPKSVEVYKAYNNVKMCLRNHKGPLPSVPLHLRNAPTKLMKNLGYAKGYKYNPNYSGPVKQEYLPEELRGVDFFTWTPSDS
ncbi:ATPase WRNIP1 [Danio rerio]|uniref:ATPase WRNIP1 n=1 Tax=Danio rerio TaxID=7955 RepID=Q6NW46_DANRE|nr:ATPase WRNIP1 [Danio rerio]AAH67729.1 Zgc:85976 [Danio rerio]|eukprot:NP_998085.1 ATPase WRNIP1 [Danio rerio]